jgi:tetratricopeptide (TPR) repeat protein
MRTLVYNPSFLPPEERVRQFVVRREELRTILRVLEGNTGPSHQHLLVLGGRGLGKSTLVQRVVAEVERTALSERWYPLVFPEETYEAANIGEFWLEALYRLADKTSEPRWVELHRELHRERDAKRLAQRARHALKAFAEEKGRNLLLVVENLDMLMDQLDDEDAWALRETLQTDPTFMLLATALRPFEAITDHAKPFYEGFRRIELCPLGAEEIEELWRMVTGNRPGLARARAVRVLTGGNPRMVVLLAQLADGHTLRGILEDLTRLVDAHTDYFKSNIEALDGQMRRVFLALATLWHPATAGQVAEEARLDGNVVSTSLTRLERQGRIEVVGKKGKNRQYQVAERLYNIYYLMRRRGTDARLKALIDFMVLFYEPEELGGFVQRLAGEATNDGDDPCVHAIGGLLRAHRGYSEARAAILRALPGEFLDRVDKREVSLSKRKPEELLALIQRPDGERFLPDAARLLDKTPSEDNPTYAELAERVVLAANPRIALNGAFWLADHRLWRIIELFDTSKENTEILVLVGTFISLVRDELDAIEAWYERLRSQPALFPKVQAELQLYLDPTNEEAARTAFADLDGRISIVETLLSRLYTAGARTNLELLARALSDQLPEEPWALAALVETQVGLGNLDEAHAGAERLLGTGAAPEYAEIFAALVDIAQGELASAHRHLVRSLAVRPTDKALILQAELAVIRGEIATATSLSREIAVREPSCAVAWYILAKHAPAEAISSWKSLVDPTPDDILEFSDAAVHATDRRLWETALESASRSENDPSLAVAITRLHGLSGRADLALATFSQLAQRSDAGTAGQRAMMSMALALAASGQGEATARVLASAASRVAFRPLIAALDASAIQDLSAEERSIAEDVAARLEEFRRSTNVWTEGATAPTDMAFPSLTVFETEAPAKPQKRKSRRKTRPVPELPNESS